MNRPLPLNNPAEAISAPAEPLTGTVVVYDPAMCCSTGLCGPGVDPALLALARDLRWLQGRGVTVERHGLSQEPEAFLRELRVAGLMQAFGDGGLPATLVNGQVLVHGRYPTRDELTAALAAPSPSDVAGTAGCDCGPGSTCC